MRAVLAVSVASLVVFAATIILFYNIAAPLVKTQPVSETPECVRIYAKARACIESEKSNSAHMGITIPQ